MKAPHSKCGVRATVPGVRISPHPPPYAFGFGWQAILMDCRTKAIRRRSVSRSSSWSVGRRSLCGMSTSCASQTATSTWDPRTTFEGGTHRTRRGKSCRPRPTHPRPYSHTWQCERERAHESLSAISSPAPARRLPARDFGLRTQTDASLVGRLLQPRPPPAAGRLFVAMTRFRRPGRPTARSGRRFCGGSVLQSAR